MTTRERYATPAAFKQALENRIRQAATTDGVPISRVRQTLVFERFLARVFEAFGARAVAKGGVVLELRLHRARSTKDVDLRIDGSPNELLASLQAAGRLDLGDRIEFRVERDREHPTMKAEGMVYEGHRFRAEAQLAGKIYGARFGIDVAHGDVLNAEPEVVLGTDLLRFAGIKRPRLRIYPREARVAEKVHAYTLPRRRENSRVKDLPDIALLAGTGPFEAKALREAVEATFVARGTHPVPNALPDPPRSWAAQYERLADVDGLPWPTMVELLKAVRAFIDPVLSAPVGKWDPKTNR